MVLPVRRPAARATSAVGLRSGPFPTQKAAEEELAATLARLGGGGQVSDRSVLTGAYLDNCIQGKLRLKPRTLATNREIVRLYWKPALGHLRLVDLRDHHLPRRSGR